MWIILALASALGQASRFAVSKSLTKNFTASYQNWLMNICGIPFIILFAIFTFQGIPWDSPEFMISTGIATVAFTIANILIVKGTELSPLSLTVPFLALTPIPAIFIEWLTLGNLPTIYGALGIILVAIGSYMLHASESKKGILEPRKAILREKGSMLAITGALLMSIGGVLAKYSIEYGDVTSYALTWTSMNIILGTIIVAIWDRKSTKEIKKTFSKKHIVQVVATGFLFAFTLITNFVAVTFTNASYVLTVKRTSAFFGVLIGWLVFREIKIQERAIGATIMVAGVVLISVLG